MEFQDTLKVFDFDGKCVRVVEIDGQPWWVARDVCHILGLANVKMSVSKLDEDEKGTSKICTPGGNQSMTVINESGLYCLIMRSNKAEAKKFRRWITMHVLPEIRRHGAYLTDRKIAEILSSPDTIIKLAHDLKAERENCAVLLEKLNDDLPKVLFAESVEASVSTILIGDLAKIMKQNGIDIGPNRLFEWMRDNGYLMKNSGSRNMPTQKAMEAGLFKISERVICDPSGSLFLMRTTRVTGRGQVYFINLFMNSYEHDIA